MIAVDSNVLVRYLAQDDTAQSPLATALMENRLTPENPGFISIPVLCEAIRILSQLYGCTRDDLLVILGKLIEAAELVVDEADVVRAAMELAEVDLTNAIIHAIGRARGCDLMLTFDRSFARSPQVELLTAWRAS